MRSFLPLFGLALAASAPALASETVPLAPFREVELSGGGEVVVVPGPVQRVTLIEGSSRFTRLRIIRGNQLKIDTCTEQCPHTYRLRIQIQSPSVPDLAISGGGLISVGSGFRAQHELATAISGGGKIDARGVEASDSAAAVHGGGAIRYWGRPVVSTAIHGGGLVRPGN
jgi:hypothetical protein